MDDDEDPPVKMFNAGMRALIDELFPISTSWNLVTRTRFGWALHGRRISFGAIADHEYM
jgi:hypothetical protein